MPFVMTPLIPRTMAQSNHSGDTPVPPLTLRERLGLIPIMAKMPFAIALGVFYENKGRSWSRAANVAMMRYLFCQKWDIHTLRSFIGVTTTQAYQAWTAQVKLEALTDILPEKAKLHWIGPRPEGSQSRVLLYFYGGAFSLPPRPDYFPFLHAIQKAGSASLGNFSVALMEHAMMPDSPFPTQLSQATVALTYLLNMGIPPSNIILSGDSAGGNLIIQLGAHFLRPIPSIPAPPTLSQPLAGGLLVSPWNIYNVDSPAYARNDKKDVLDIRTYSFVSGLVKYGLAPELQHYSEPSLAPPDWLKGLDKVYSRFLLTAGSEECPLDQTIETRDVLSRYVRDTELVVAPGLAHGEVIYRFATNEGGVGEDWDAIVAFLTKSFAVEVK